MRSSFEVLEVAGFRAAILGMRNPTKTRGRSDSCIDSFGTFHLGDDDKRLSRSLLEKGDVHGKFQRGIHCWVDIEVSRGLWSELDTYTVGVSPISSESTMYTLRRECSAVTEDMFSDVTPKFVIEGFIKTLEQLTEMFGSRRDIPIEVLKASVPEGWMQKRTKVFSYQSLRRMYMERRDHRLPEWQVICRGIENLPLAEDLLLVGVNK